MGNRVDAPMPGRKSGAMPKYPWDEWLDGSVWELTRPGDFQISPRGFATLARHSARMRGLYATVRIRGEDKVFVQATKKEAGQ